MNIPTGQFWLLKVRFCRHCLVVYVAPAYLARRDRATDNLGLSQHLAWLSICQKDSDRHR